MFWYPESDRFVLRHISVERVNAEFNPSLGEGLSMLLHTPTPRLGAYLGAEFLVLKQLCHDTFHTQSQWWHDHGVALRQAAGGLGFFMVLGGTLANSFPHRQRTSGPPYHSCA